MGICPENAKGSRRVHWRQCLLPHFSGFSVLEKTKMKMCWLYVALLYRPFPKFKSVDAKWLKPRKTVLQRSYPVLKARMRPCVKSIHFAIDLHGFK